jgi:hypothetical protein
VPDEQAVFLGLKSYRNNGDGIFMHLSHNLAVDGALLVDNAMGMALDESDNLQIRNSEIVGQSALYQSQGLASVCRGSSMVGIQLQPLTLKGSNGAIMKNLTFSGFTNTICSDSTIFNLAARPDVRFQIGMTARRRFPL